MVRKSNNLNFYLKYTTLFVYFWTVYEAFTLIKITKARLYTLDVSIQLKCKSDFLNCIILLSFLPARLLLREPRGRGRRSFPKPPQPVRGVQVR